MNIIESREDEIPAFPPGYEAEMKALAERPDSEIDFSDIPEMDDSDFNYTVSLAELAAMNKTQRTKLAQKLLAAKEADRAARNARQEVEQAIAEVRVSERLPVEA